MKMVGFSAFWELAIYLRASSEHVYQKNRLGEYFEGIEKKIRFFANFGSFWGSKGPKMTP